MINVEVEQFLETYQIPYYNVVIFSLINYALYIPGTKIKIGNEGETKRNIKRHSKHKEESQNQKEMLLVAARNGTVPGTLLTLCSNVERKNAQP